MKNGSFFMDYEFNGTISGFHGKLTGHKIYSVDRFEDVERLISDALKVLKTGGDACVTFEHFDLTSTELSRVYTRADGVAETVTWTRNIHGYVSHTQTAEIPLTKKSIKAFVLEAIELFRAEDAGDAA